MLTLRRSLIGVPLAAAVAVVLATAAPASALTVTFTDDFGTTAATPSVPTGSYPLGSITEGATYGNFTDVFNGARYNSSDNTYTYGSQSIVQDSGGTKYLQVAPPAAQDSAHTYATLSTTKDAVLSGNYTLTVEYGNETQLRTGSTPNAWERGWVLWNYNNNNAFYYLILKSTGWEVGKEVTNSDGSQGQVFLASGTSPTYSLGSWKRAVITQTVDANGVPTFVVKARIGSNALTTLATVTDANGFGGTNPPATNQGKVGLYSEDAQVQFGWVQVQK